MHRYEVHGQFTRRGHLLEKLHIKWIGHAILGCRNAIFEVVILRASKQCSLFRNKFLNGFACKEINSHFLHLAGRLLAIRKPDNLPTLGVRRRVIDIGKFKCIGVCNAKMSACMLQIHRIVWKGDVKLCF